MGPETDLLPVHSCASRAAKSTQTTRSECFYNPLVSVRRRLEPAERSVWKLLYIVDGKTERGMIGRLHNFEKMIIMCVDIYPVVRPLTRSTGRVLSTAGGSSCSLAPRQLQKRQEMHIIPSIQFASLLQNIDVSGCSPMPPHWLQFRQLPPSRYSYPFCSVVSCHSSRKQHASRHAGGAHSLCSARLQPTEPHEIDEKGNADMRFA